MNASVIFLNRRIRGYSRTRRYSSTIGSETKWVIFPSRIAVRICAGEPRAEIKPLTKTFVSSTRRGSALSASTTAFSDRLYRLADDAFNFPDRKGPIGGPHFVYRLPGIHMLQGPPYDYRLSKDAADRDPLLERLPGNFFMHARRHTDMHLTIKASCHQISKDCLYHYTMV